MDTRNLSHAKRLWLGCLIVVGTCHIGRSLGQTSPSFEGAAGSHVQALGVSHSIPTTDATLPSVSKTVLTSAAPAPSNPWAGPIAQAVANLRAESIPQPAMARQSLQVASEELRRFLATARDNREADWLSFLQWNDLQKELAEAEPDVDRLIQIERNMRQNYLGLEMRPFVQLRQRLGEYIAAARFGQDGPSTIETISKRLEQLSTTLQSPPQGADSERQREIGLVTSFLSQANQAPDLVQALQSQYSRPNLRVLVSRDFVSRQFSRPVDQPSPVNEMILGTHVVGQSFMHGSVSPFLLDSPHRASLRLLLLGQMTSTTVGTNRGVRIHSQGSSQVQASETISLTDNGLVAHRDTSVIAPLHTTITGIEHKLRLVRRIASKKAAQQKPQADAIAEDRLENRVANQFHQQLVEQLSETNAKMSETDFRLFSRLGLTRPSRSSWSSPDLLALRWKQQEPDQLAAPSSCPLVVPQQGITIQLHQSAIMNLIDPVIGGRIIRNDQLDDLASQFDQPPSAELLQEATGEPWSISMAGYHPLEVEFDDQLIRFRIRTTKLDRGDQALEQPATIEAAYRVELRDGAIQLVREGEVNIAFAGRAQRGLRAVTLRSFLKNKFDKVFKEELLDKPLRPTDRLPENLPPLRIVEVLSDEGWLQATLL